jgi:hypothetical protein
MQLAFTHACRISVGLRLLLDILFTCSIVARDAVAVCGWELGFDEGEALEQAIKYTLVTREAPARPSSLENL